MAHTGIDQESHSDIKQNSAQQWSGTQSFSVDFSSYVRVAHNYLGRDLSFSFSQWDTKTMLMLFQTCISKRLLERGLPSLLM